MRYWHKVVVDEVWSTHILVVLPYNPCVNGIRATIEGISAQIERVLPGRLDLEVILQSRAVDLTPTNGAGVLARTELNGIVEAVLDALGGGDVIQRRLFDERTAQRHGPVAAFAPGGTGCKVAQMPVEGATTGIVDPFHDEDVILVGHEERAVLERIGMPRPH